MSNDRIMNLISECCYSNSSKDYVKNAILELNLMDNTILVCKIMKDNEKIIAVKYNVPVVFKEVNYFIPIMILFYKPFPKTPPEFILETPKNLSVNPSNKSIDSFNKKITVSHLRTWGVFSSINTIIKEIKESFSKDFPVYKNKSSDDHNLKLSTEVNKIEMPNQVVSSKSPDVRISNNRHNSIPERVRPMINLDAEIKKKLVEILKNQIEASLKEEVLAIRKQEEVLIKYKIEFQSFNLQTGNPNQLMISNLIKVIADIKRDIADVKKNISNYQTDISETNYQKFLSIKNGDLIKACAVEATIEDLISVLKKAFARGTIDFIASMQLTRELSKEIILVRFYKEKLIRKSK